MTTEVRLLQCRKASEPMHVTELGMVTEVIPEPQNPFPKTLSAMSLVPSSITTSPERYSPLVASKMLSLYISPSGWLLYHGVLKNASLPTELTELGILIDDKLEQAQNAPPPMRVMVLGIMIFWRLLQLKAYSPIVTVPVGIVYSVPSFPAG